LRTPGVLVGGHDASQLVGAADLSKRMGRVMARSLALICLPLLCGAIAVQLSTAKGYRHWLFFGFETVALLTCLSAIL
jgi:hypothetical protein